MKEFSAGSTVEMVWQSSGTTVSSVGYTVTNGSETIVNTGYLTSSGNGHYYGYHTSVASMDAFYAVRFEAYVEGRPYFKKVNYRTILGEVD